MLQNRSSPSLRFFSAPWKIFSPTLLLFLFYNFICWLIVGCAGSSRGKGFSLVAGSGRCFLARCTGFSSQRLLIAAASLAQEHGLPGACASVVAVLGLQGTGSEVVELGLSCSEACGIFLNHGSNPCLLYWQADCLPLSCQESPTLLLE